MSNDHGAKVATWYIARDGAQVGSLTRTDIASQVHAGELGPDDLVWCAGWPEWRRAGEIFQLPRAVRPPMPPPAAVTPKPVSSVKVSAVGSRRDSAASTPTADDGVTHKQQSLIRRPWIVWGAVTALVLAVGGGAGWRMLNTGSEIARAPLEPASALAEPASANAKRKRHITLEAALTVLQGHTSEVESAAFSPDGTHIVTGSWDNTARLWDAQSGASIATLTGHTDAVVDAAFSPDGSRIVTASKDGTARLWDAKSGAPISTLSGHKDRIFDAEFSPDSTSVVTASFDGTARVWDAHSAAPLATLSGHENVVNAAAFSSNGTRIVTASADKTARVWDAKTGTLLVTLTGHADNVERAAFSADGSRILTASPWDNTVRLWDAQSGASLFILSQSPVAAFSPDGTRILAGSQLWDAKTGAVLMPLSGRPTFSGVATVSFSADGSRIITTEILSTEAQIWDASTGSLIATMSASEERYSNDLNSAVFSPDGTRVLTASDDDKARIWDVAPDRLASMAAAAPEAFVQATQSSTFPTCQVRDFDVHFDSDGAANYNEWKPGLKQYCFIFNLVAKFAKNDAVIAAAFPEIEGVRSATPALMETLNEAFSVARQTAAASVCSLDSDAAALMEAYIATIKQKQRVGENGLWSAEQIAFIELFFRVSDAILGNKIEGVDKTTGEAVPSQTSPTACPEDEAAALRASVETQIDSYKRRLQ